MSRSASILIAYNLPFLLWTGWAAIQPWARAGGIAWGCPVHGLLGWCPSCGMTTAYAGLLHHGTIPPASTCLVIAIFLANAVVSAVRAWRIEHPAAVVGAAA